MAGPISLFYTVSLRGRLDILPRLFTWIRQERAKLDHPSLLIDLGDSCLSGNWLCDATGGRALLVAMDSMGYDAFCLDAEDLVYGQTDALTKLRDTILTPILLEDQTLLISKRQAESVPLRVQLLGAGGTPSEDAALRVRVARGPTVCEQVQSTLLIRDQWDKHAPLLGRIDVSLPLQIIAHTRRELPATVPPDPTISSVIEFVESEARYAARKKA